MNDANSAALQAAFLRELSTRPKPLPPVWPRWLTDLWIRDLVTTRGETFVMTAKGRAELEHDPVPAARHEFVIVVDAASRDAAAAAKPGLLEALVRRFPEVIFSLVSADCDFVDGGRYMLIPCRGSTGGTLKPMPPAKLQAEIAEALEAMRFLDAPLLQ